MTVHPRAILAIRKAHPTWQSHVPSHIPPDSPYATKSSLHPLISISPFPDLQKQKGQSEEEERTASHLLPRLIAVCAIHVVLVPPCQCLSPGGTCTISPTCSFRGAWPSEQTSPEPIVTVRICPRSWWCQYVRAPGVKQTLLPMQSSAVTFSQISK